MNRLEDLLHYWAANLVGTSGKFILIIGLSALGGFLYSFGLIPHIYMLVIFGGVSPIIFIACLYTLIGRINRSEGAPVPQLFRSARSLNLLMLIDIAIVLAVAFLIATNVINYLLVRILQTILLPLLMLLLLRFLLVVGRMKGA